MSEARLYCLGMKIRKLCTIPNFLTLLRLLAIPVMAYFILTEIRPVRGFVLFAAIWFTDCLDGYIARHYNQVSEVGKIFDPAVDKLFQLTTAIMMCIVGRLPLWVPIFIFVREIFMVIGGAVLLKHKTVVYAQWFGKLTTVLFALAFAALFFWPKEQLHWASLLFVLPCACSLLALVKYGLYYFFPPRQKSVQEVEIQATPSCTEQKRVS